MVSRLGPGRPATCQVLVYRLHLHLGLPWQPRWPRFLSSSRDCISSSICPWSPQPDSHMAPMKPGSGAWWNALLHGRQDAPPSPHTHMHKQDRMAISPPERAAASSVQLLPSINLAPSRVPHPLARDFFLSVIIQTRVPFQERVCQALSESCNEAVSPTGSCLCDQTFYIRSRNPALGHNAQGEGDWNTCLWDPKCSASALQPQGLPWKPCCHPQQPHAR